MKTQPEYRTSPRVEHKAVAMIETRGTGNAHYATMYNFSGDGMYCGSDCSMRPGTPVTIRLCDLPYKSAPRIYLGEVRRCEELAGDADSHLFGIGIKIFKAIYD